MKIFASLLLTSFSFFICSEVITDGSLGELTTLDGPDYLIDQSLGEVAGANLFHSFSEFNLLAGESATFTGDNSITNVIGRITGGESTIDGQVNCSIDGANLFLLNQSGILFGPNASINLTGSFHASTADYLQLGENERFYSTPINGELLSSASPESFGLFSNQNGTITVDGAQLAVAGDKTISLTADGIEIKNGALIKSTQGVVNLTSFSQGVVSCSDNSSDIIGSDLFVTENSTIDASGFGGGRIYIKGGQVVIDSSKVQVENSGGITGGEIAVQADGLILVRESAIHSETKSSATSAEINLNVGTLTLENSNIETITSGRNQPGSAGDISISANEISLVNSDINSKSLLAVGNTGDITVLSKNLTLQNDSVISNSKFGMGFGKNGSINLNIEDELLISGSQIGTETVLGMVNGGDINIKTENLTLEKHASIYSTSRGIGSAGTLTINAANMKVLSGSMVETSALSQGAGGDINLNIDESLTIDGSFTIEGGNSYTSQILSESIGSGDGGNVYINADSLFLTNGGAISTASEATSNPGDAGNVTIDTKTVHIAGGQITAESTGSTGGQIDITADDYLSLVNAQVTTEVHNGAGDAGDITIDTSAMVMNNSIVRADAFGGDGGNIFVNADAILKNAESYFDASSELGISGEIVLTAPEVYINEETEELVTEFLPAEDWVNDSARARLGHLNSFVISKGIAKTEPQTNLLFIPAKSDESNETQVTDELKQLLGF